MGYQQNTIFPHSEQSATTIGRHLRNLLRRRTLKHFVNQRLVWLTLLSSQAPQLREQARSNPNRR